MGQFFSLFQQINHHLKQNPDQVLYLSFQDKEAFACSRCAQCCKVPWGVGVTQKYYETWAPIFENHPEPRYRDVFFQHTQRHPEKYASLKKKQGSNHCIFLEADDGCYLHRAYGPEAKPATCRDYPRQRYLVCKQVVIDYMVGSCQSIPALLLDESEFIYTFEPKTDDSKLIFETLPIHEQLFMSQDAILLWNGLALDTLTASGGRARPLQHVRALAFPLRLLSLIGSDKVRELLPHELTHIYGQHMAQFARQYPQYHHVLAEHLEWLLQNLPKTQQSEPIFHFYQQVLAGQQTLPQLTMEEKRLVRQFMYNYFLRKLISYHAWYYLRADLFHCYFLYSAYALMFQGLLLSYKHLSRGPITMRLIRMAINIVEINMVHSHTWFQEFKITEMQPETCLEQGLKFFQFDIAA